MDNNKFYYLKGKAGEEVGLYRINGTSKTAIRKAHGQLVRLWVSEKINKEEVYEIISGRDELTQEYLDIFE